MLLAAVFLTFTLSLALTWGVRGLALRWGAVAQPKADRWHRRPTAMLGGVAIFIAFAVGVIACVPPTREFVVIGVAAAMLFVVGLVDDFIHIQPPTKFALQLLAAALVVSSGLVIHWTGFALVRDLLTGLWLVGITNAFNLLDNMDGLAAGIAVIGGAFLALSQFGVDPRAALVPALLAAAVLGFLVFNFHPASIFMGDCGSMFLGFSLGALALVGMQYRTRGFVPVLFAPVLLLMLPILDTSLVTFARLVAGRPVSRGGRDHTSHRLVALGLSERGAVLLLYAFAILCGGAALLLSKIPVAVSLFIVPALLLAVFFAGLHLGHVRVYPDTGPTPAGAFRVLVDFSYKRRIMEMALDLVLMLLALYGAFLLRFNGFMPGEQQRLFFTALPLLVGVQLGVFVVLGMYRGLWRYIDLDDLFPLASTVALASAVAGGGVWVLQRLPRLSIAVLILNGLLLLLFVVASRLSFRAFRNWIVRLHAHSHPQCPVLIYGAGDRGARLVRSLREYPNGHRPIAIVDDNPQKAGRRLHGCPIVGWEAVPPLIGRYGLREVLISTPKIPDAHLARARALDLTATRVNAEW